MIPPPSPLLYRQLVEEELRSDLGMGGDLTTDFLLREDGNASASIVSREKGVLAGLPPALYAFTVMDPNARFDCERRDGDRIGPAETIVRISAAPSALLGAERTALNILSHLSGVAAKTRRFADAVDGTGCRILDTRKTLPGLRALQKYAVRCGGGRNHRFGLDGAVMVKDNHLAAFPSPAAGITELRSRLGPTVRIEIEVDTLEQLQGILELPIDIVLLDNMTLPELRAAISLIGGRFATEASGGITLESVRAVAETGVDYISVGALTHSAAAMDFGLDFD